MLRRTGLRYSGVRPSCLDVAIEGDNERDSFKLHTTMTTTFENSVMSLPAEIWFLVFGHCDVQSIVNLGHTNSVLLEILRSDSLEKVLERAVATACPFMSLAEVLDAETDLLDPPSTEWLQCALVLDNRMNKHTKPLREALESATPSKEYSYLADLNGLRTTEYSPGMQKLLSADDSSFARQMVLRKAKVTLVNMLGGQGDDGQGDDETRFFDNGVELVAQKGNKMLVVKWRDGKLDLKNVQTVSCENQELGTTTTITQLTGHTLVIRSSYSSHSFHLLQDTLLLHLFTFQAPTPPPVFDYNGYLWTVLDNQLFSIFSIFNEEVCSSYLTRTSPIDLPDKQLTSSFCTFAETPFRHQNGKNRYLLLSANPYTSCDFFVDLKTGQKHASRPLEAHDKVYPALDRQQLCFVRGR